MGKCVSFVLLFFCFSCVGNVNAKPNKLPEYLKYVKEVSSSFETEMKKEFGVVCIGSGGSMPHDVEKIDIRLLSYRHATIEQAREIEIIATEKLLGLIHSHKKLRSFLREYPFTSSRAVVAISFYKKNNDHYKDNSVAYVFHVRDRVYYRAMDPTTGNFIPLADEPYQEALKKVQNTQKGKVIPESE